VKKNITINPKKYSTIRNLKTFVLFSLSFGAKIIAKFRAEIEIKRLKKISDNFVVKNILCRK